MITIAIGLYIAISIASTAYFLREVLSIVEANTGSRLEVLNVVAPSFARVRYTADYMEISSTYADSKCSKIFLSCHAH